MRTLEFAVVRYNYTEGYTAGKMYANGRFICYTLEDEVREVDGKPVSAWKIKGETAIPRGRYEMELSHSPKFGRVLPILLNVPGYTGVRIHRGNKAEHTEGCILLGNADGNDRDAWLGNSAVAEKAFIPIMNDAMRQGLKVFITLV